MSNEHKIMRVHVAVSKYENHQREYLVCSDFMTVLFNFEDVRVLQFAPVHV